MGDAWEDGAGWTSDRLLAAADAIQADLEQVVGTGRAADGQVVATAGADGSVLEVAFGERAMRVGSQALAEHVCSAVADAQDDAAARVRELMGEAVEGFDLSAAEERLSGLIDPPPGAMPRRG
ncbi:YbaB/EbfC family nucleoid-associated protein [Nonomuraea phyllanthi]|uniref:YbaB/EbfC family nucleoid-associated protein n=1 Tax=Nonomuraea phyllanthi TaxID=2219224 RepID=UPI00186ACC90|nr:YbaB/EbfC family nucleoid-associated protein [Nonomuraea phyllanthi]